MQVKLTESGLKLFGVGGEREVINVSNDRAHHLMVNGYANKDNRFMSMFEANHPKKAAGEKPKAAKKEKATSKKAAAREKAVKK